MQNAPKWTIGVHHDGSDRYVSNPLPAFNETITIKLRTPKSAPIKRVYLRTRFDGEFHRVKMTDSEQDTVSQWWQADLTIPQPSISYCFKILTEDGTAYYYNAHHISRSDSPDWFHFRLLADYQAPLWVRETVFYQIFPERFHNGDLTNDVPEGAWEMFGFHTQQRQWGDIPYHFREAGNVDFFGGDLQGIQQKLDYLTDLGVNGIYLTPIFDARTNHFYDVIDYHKVADHLGGDQALANLRTAMDDKEMRLMLDITTNHCGYWHHWYQEALEDHDSPAAEYFYYDDESRSFEHWLGVPLLVKLNYTSPAMRDVMYRDPDSIMRHWLKEPYRIDAWRIDVANMTANYREHQQAHEVWQEMRSYLKQNKPDTYILGEYFQDGTPHIQGDELDATMNYQGFNIPVRRWLGGNDLGVDEDKEFSDPTLLPTEAMAMQWQQYLSAIPYVIALQQFTQLGSHDVSRILNVTDGDKALVQLGTALLMTFPGAPCIYYADEIGMEGGIDPDNRRCMRWDKSTWDQDLLDFHKQVIHLRRTSHALAHGGFQVLHAEGDVIAFQRQSNQQQLVIIGNRGQDTGNVSISVKSAGIADGATLTDLISGKNFTTQDGKLALDRMEHGTALILDVG